MKKQFLFLVILFLLFSVMLKAEVADSSLFGGWIGGTFSAHLTGKDMANRFGPGFTAGTEAGIKFASNWTISTEYNYLFGNSVKELGMLDSIKTSGGYLIDEGGMLANITFLERGFSVFLTGGRIFNFNGINKNSGLQVSMGAGMLQHKIRIDYMRQVNNPIPQLSDEYKTGYDRLTNGFALNEFIGYFYMGKNRVINFKAGFEFVQALTKNRRFNFDTRSLDNRQRLDLLYGIKIEWFFPIMKRLPDKYYYY